MRTKTKVQTGENISYTVTTANSEGKPVSAEVSLGVVDEAIYALREDNPAALREAFFPWRYSRVQTRYSFAVQYLGDANKAEPKIAARSKFKDTAYWNPAVKTDAAGRATVSFNLPDNLTTWRATAVGRWGRQSDEIPPKSSQLRNSSSASIRRDLHQNDQARISAFIHNDTGAKQKAP